jgi:undecaprenyl-diphosphatase
MITTFQAIVLGILQGISELFPISSLGHSVILPRLLGWPIHQQDNFFLTFLIGTHFATALVLFFFFWKDWVKIIAGVVCSLKNREIGPNDADAKLGWLLIVATIPAGILGLLFEDQLRATFVTPQSAAFFLFLNGFLLLGAEYLRRKKAGQPKEKDSDARIANLTFKQATIVGSLQAMALIPGFSRTGASIAGGLLVGLSHEDAARYSFLLATPIIGAAALLKLPDLASSKGQVILVPTLVGAFFAAIFAYLAVRFLTKYFETQKLTPFALYCLGTGLTTSLIFLF